MSLTPTTTSRSISATSHQRTISLSKFGLFPMTSMRNVTLLHSFCFDSKSNSGYGSLLQIISNNSFLQSSEATLKRRREYIDINNNSFAKNDINITYTIASRPDKNLIKNIPKTSIEIKQNATNFYSRHIKRLAKIGESNERMKNSIAFINQEKNFQHRMIRWKDAINLVSEAGENLFISEFAPSIWILSDNFRKNEPENRYFAGDVFLYQYLIYTIMTDNTTYLPRTIKMSTVINKETLKMTENLTSESKELLNIFMKQTPIGKSIQRMLLLINVHATEIKKEVNISYGEVSVNFYVTVAPRPRRITLSNFLSNFIQKYQPFSSQQVTKKTLDYLPNEEPITLSSPKDIQQQKPYLSKSFLSRFTQKYFPR